MIHHQSYMHAIMVCGVASEFQIYQYRRYWLSDISISSILIIRYICIVNTDYPIYQYRQYWLSDVSISSISIICYVNVVNTDYSIYLYRQCWLCDVSISSILIIRYINVVDTQKTESMTTLFHRHIVTILLDLIQLAEVLKSCLHWLKYRI